MVKKKFLLLLNIFQLVTPVQGSNTAGLLQEQPASLATYNTATYNRVDNDQHLSLSSDHGTKVNYNYMTALMANLTVPFCAVLNIILVGLSYGATMSNLSVPTPYGELLIMEESASLGGAVFSIIWNILSVVLFYVASLPSQSKIFNFIKKALKFLSVAGSLTILIMLFTCIMDGSNIYTVYPSDSIYTLKIPVTIGSWDTIIEIPGLSFSSECGACSITGSSANAGTWNFIQTVIEYTKEEIKEIADIFGQKIDLSGIPTISYFNGMLAFPVLSYIVGMFSSILGWSAIAKEQETSPDTTMWKYIINGKFLQRT